MSTVTWSIQHKRDTAANFTANNPTLLAGQIGIETDLLTTTPKFKIGDGTTAWTALPYFYGGTLSAQNLSNVLSVGNNTNGQKIVVDIADSIDYNPATANEIAYFNAGKTLASLTTATYPSLTELSYVKGVTSNIQTQLNNNGKYILAAIGDSRFANSIQNQGTSPFSINWSNQGILTWFNYLTSQKYYMPYTYDLAVSGYTVAQTLALVPSVLVLSPKPKYCLVLAGTNSISAGVTLASMQTDFASIASQLKAGGVDPVFLIDMPRTVASWTTAYNQTHHALNNWLRVWCNQNGYVLCDYEYLITSQTTGEPIYNVSDGIHQNCTGAYLIGNALATLMTSIEPAFKNNRQQSVYDVYNATYNTYGNLTAYGLIQGTTGTNTGTGASGTVATGWNNRVVSGTCTSVASKENPRSDGLMGDKQILTITATTTSLVRFALASNITTNYSVGDIIVVEADIDCTTSSLLDFISVIIIDLSGASATLGTSAGFKGATSGAYPMPTSSISGRVSTIPFAISATSASIAIRIEAQVEAGGNATIKIGNVTVRKVI